MSDGSQAQREITAEFFEVYRVQFATKNKREERSMRRRLIGFAVAFVPLAFAGLAVAGSGGNGNGFPSGPHYNLNIIGGSCKDATLTGSNRHTIFVPLGSKTEAATSNIYLCQGPTFQVLDGNACTAAIGCDLSGKTGAVFQLPCDLYAPDGTITDCTAGTDSATYCVFAEALGTPGGQATITTCATDPNTGQVVCSTDNTVLVRNTNTNGSGNGGKPKVQNVTDALTTLTCFGAASATPTCGDICSGTQCTFEIFTAPFEDFFWQYDNNGLRNAQLRFYLEPAGTNCDALF
jgi:hypothetical protein